MKNFVAIWSIVLMLTGASGITVISHLCQGQQVYTQLYSSDTKDCCQPKKNQNACHSSESGSKSPSCHKTENSCNSGHEKNANNDCCKDVIHTFKLNELYSLKANVLPKAVENTLLIYTSLEFLLNTEDFNNLQPVFSHNHSPPYQSQPLFITCLSILC